MKPLIYNLARASEAPRDFVNEDWVKTQVNYLREAYKKGGDDEFCHSAADSIHRIVLRAIAEGISWPCTCAHEALQTEKIGFERWCA